jgi:ribA/ribD-fused uncharacterized protein
MDRIGEPFPFGDERTYRRAEVAVFHKTKDDLGGLSNMAGGFPLVVAGVQILTSEALYQACRFPHRPDVQRLIIAQASPMAAKMKSKPHRADTRAGWDDDRVTIMRWCLRVKLAQHPERFGRLLLATSDRPIVEQSRRDAFWGAKPLNEDMLAGQNVLGRLLTELRDELRGAGSAAFTIVEPPRLPTFLLYGLPIGVVQSSTSA